MKFISLILTISLFLSSCTHFNYQSDFSRFPSSESITVDDVLSFRKAETPGKDIKKEVQQYVANAFYGKFKSEFVPSQNLPSDVAFKVEMNVVNGEYLVRIHHSADAFTHHQAVIGLCGFTDNFTNNNKTINTPYSIFEMYYNAKEKDVISMDNLLKLRQQFTLTGIQATFSEAQEDLVTKAKAEAQDLHEALTPAIKSYEKNRKAQKEIRKAAIEALDKAADDKQFKALVARNDRAGVADLLKKYLPYEDMAPFEKRYWDNYLDIIRHPVPHEERIFVYRGINDDFIHQAVIHGQEVDKATAIKDGKAFVMSTVLVKNQGSWNRRLRSLESMEEKFIGTVQGSSDMARSARITTMFKNHSIDPKGSPFLSFTPNISVSKTFGSQKNSAYLIDPRVLQFNFTSGYDNEKEFLAGLITFPDEMIGIWSYENNSGVDHEQFFKQRLADFVETKFGKADKDKVIKEIEKNTYDFFAPVFKIGNIASSSSAPAKQTLMGTMADFFKSFVGNKKEPIPTFDVKGDLSCDDMIKAFWVK